MALAQRRNTYGGLPRLEHGARSNSAGAIRRSSAAAGAPIALHPGMRRSNSSPSVLAVNPRPSPQGGLSVGGLFGQGVGPSRSNSKDTGCVDRSPLDNQRSHLSSPLENLDAVLFLDIDGVVHSVQVQHPRQQFDRRCMLLLVEILTKTEATIVLSTAWRAHAEARQMIADKLKEYGLPLFVSRTPQIAMFKRTREIMAWVRKYQPKTWVSIDDLPLGEENPDEMTGHFVQTRARTGLQQDTAQMTIDMFREQKMRLQGIEPAVVADNPLLLEPDPKSAAAAADLYCRQPVRR